MPVAVTVDRNDGYDDEGKAEDENYNINPGGGVANLARHLGRIPTCD